ncbi:hypothetical protein ACHWQZ_G015720 [Mnemiopsis leidyi]
MVTSWLSPLFITMICLFRLEYVECGGTGQVQLLRYQDSVWPLSPDFFFKPFNIIDEDGTILHEVEETDPNYKKQRDIFLIDVPELKDPITIKFSHQKRVFFEIGVWSYFEDEGEPEPSLVRKIENVEIPFSSKLPGDGLTTDPRSIDTPGSIKLTFQYQILQCDKGFAGAGCSECAKGFTGESCSECETGFTGDSCSECAEGLAGDSCSECADNYYPAGQCTKFCVPETGKHICTNEGEMKCAEDFYGEGCTVFCVETSTYTCNANDQGQKICKDDYYPEGECTVYCKETTSFTCDTEGKWDCKEMYFPSGECSRYCKPEEDKYTCSEEGERMCDERRQGIDCEECAAHYFGENCSTFCKPDEEYTCSEIGEKICLKDCKKSYNTVIVGIVVAAVLLAMLAVIGIILCVTRDRRRKRKAATAYIAQNAEVVSNSSL